LTIMQGKGRVSICTECFDKSIYNTAEYSVTSVLFSSADVVREQELLGQGARLAAGDG